MVQPRVGAGGGFAALWYVLKKSRDAGGWLRLYQRMAARNACKTCALGMGGQRGGMTNEAGHFPEVCKKSVQAQVGDMQKAITEGDLARLSLADIDMLSSSQCETLGRLTFPIIAEPGDQHYRRISWDEAMERAAAALRGCAADEAFFYSSGRASNEAAFLLQLVARAYGCSNIHNCSFYCHQASSVALGHVYGSTTASVSLEEVAHTDVAVIVGANPASNHPRLITQLMHLRRRGGQVIIINPVKELGLVRFRVPSDWRSLLFGSSIASLYLQPHIGGDVAVHKALLKGIVERGAVDGAFVRAHTTGWEAVLADVQHASWNDLLHRSGLRRQDIDRTVDVLCRAERAVFMWAMGLTHHQHGVDNILSLANIALARGFIGAPGCGLMPIRGHSNVQGVGSMGVSPTVKATFAQHLEKLYGVRAATHAAGQDTYASMQAAAAGRVKAAFLLGGNLYGSNPDSAWAAQALNRIDCVISVTTKLNQGHGRGRGRTTLILPARARDEERAATSQESMFNYVRLSEGGELAVPGEQRSEVEILAELAERILPPGRFDWGSLRSHAALRKAMAAVVPGYDAAAQLDDNRREFHVEGRLLPEPIFPTPDGKAQFAVTPVPADILPSGTPNALRLMTLRSEGQFNTVVYEEEDLYRGTRRRDVVLMAAADAARLGLREDQPVLVQTAAGQMTVAVALADIRPGNVAMYYPEANVLVPRMLDGRSKTPAFKSVAATIRPLQRMPLFPG